MKSSLYGRQLIAACHSNFLQRFFFGVSADDVDTDGAFNVSIINDLSLFIDPFLLSHSKKEDYRRLHKDIIRNIIFLRDEVAAGRVDEGLIKARFRFPEVKKNWLGFSMIVNNGAGLGRYFAKALSNNIHTVFADFGTERISRSINLEKVCLISSGAVRGDISDFTMNLILDYICRYTQDFSQNYIDPKSPSEESG